MLIAGFVAGMIAKLFGAFGTSVVSAVTGVINNKMTQETGRQGIWAGALASAFNAELEMKKIASSERTALWGSPTYRLLTLLCVAPPAMHAAAIYFDTLFVWIDWKIPPAPAPYDMWENAIIMGFLGISAASSTVIGAIKQFRK